MSKLPKVVIIGRANVGKSTLFNRLSVQEKSLAYDYAGVTRDFIKDTVCWKDRCFDLYDTGGISLKKTTDPINEAVRQKAIGLLETADLLLLVCDATIGIHPEDREVAQLCHKLGKKTIVVVNKADAKDAVENIYEFERLGHNPIIPISATHGTGISDLLDVMTEILPITGQQEEDEPAFRVVLLGKPNVGKSSLLNALLKKERAIVAPVPGTTREALREKIAFYQQDIELTDTPGIRRKKSIDEPLETMMVRSSFRALEDADIALLLIDASEAAISDQELKLAFYAIEHHKALIILFNKQDLMDEDKQASLQNSLDRYPWLMRKVSQLSISCKSEKNIGKILPLVQDVWERYSQKFSDEALTILFKQALIKSPIFKHERELRVYKVKQIKTAPITLLMFVNEPLWFEQSQITFFENVMRDTYDLQGVPVKFIVRKA
jgi:GTP-binding protein